jgi:CheY-like chemotaxis protein
VDDQPELRRTATRVLRRLGYRVLEAADGEEGLAAFRREGTAIALVITDQVMPRMEGTAMIAALREAGATMPILLTSGGSLPPEGAADGALRGVIRLPKPWTIGDLTEGVRGAMSRES